MYIVFICIAICCCIILGIFIVKYKRRKQSVKEKEYADTNIIKMKSTSALGA